MKSDSLKIGTQNAPHRALYHALGLTEEEIERPLVGIVSSYNEIVPGHMNIDKIVDAVKIGVAMAGGTPIVFPAIAVCDGIAMGHTGMKYSLVTRDLIADSTEAMALAHGFDALVMVPNCDKNVPGLLMAAARLNVPTVFVSGGPMLAGHVDGAKTSFSSISEAVGEFNAGKITEEKLREYAHLIVSVGLNLQKGQTLILSSPVECAPFARLCVSAAYDLGAGEVVLNWTDDCITRERFLRAQDAAFEMPRPWRRAFFTDYANEGAAYLRIDAEDPETLLGVSPARLVAAQRTSSAERETFDRLQMANGFPWCVAGAPIAAWARKVFPDRSEGDAVAALWDAILKTVRVTGDGNAEARWREHIALLTARKEKLNALRFKSLHYTNSLGTDLTIALPDDHLWAAGNSETPAGVGFVANLPTEEIFTAPLKTGVNGTVCAALPLVNNGSIIEDIRFTVREGRIVEAKASRGEDVLNAAIAVDDGARYFGEVALVPYDSPISNQKILFYNTLFDENAACHLAFGEAYPECVEGGEAMSKEELKAAGLNDSNTHVDFMVGTADLSIIGTTKDGREIPVFVNGNFAL